MPLRAPKSSLPLPAPAASAPPSKAPAAPAARAKAAPARPRAAARPPSPEAVDGASDGEGGAAAAAVASIPQALTARLAAAGYAVAGVLFHLTKAGKERKTLQLRCAEGHMFEAAPSAITAKGHPKRGCPSCNVAAAYVARREETLNAWVEESGIHPVEAYVNTTTACEWECEAGHRFTAKLTALKQKPEPCTACRLEAFAEENALNLLTPWGSACGPASVLAWECRACGTVHEASLLVISRKKAPFCVDCPGADTGAGAKKKDAGAKKKGAAAVKAAVAEEDAEEEAEEEEAEEDAEEDAEEEDAEEEDADAEGGDEEDEADPAAAE